MVDLPDDQYSEKEATQRMETALRRALNTPHKPHSDLTGKKPKSPKTAKRRPAKPKSA